MRIKSSMNAFSGIILSDIKVLLSYLVCNVTNDSNASWFTGMHTEMHKNYGRPPEKLHMRKSYCNIRNFLYEKKMKLEVASQRIMRTCL